MLNFDCFTVKHGTQNIQNDCYEWYSDSHRVQQICFRPGLRPEPHWGAYSAPPDPLAGLRGPTSKGEGEGRERKKEEGKGSGREGRDRPPCAKSWIRPWYRGRKHVGKSSCNAAMLKPLLNLSPTRWLCRSLHE